MENTFKAVTEGPYDILLNNSISAMEKALNNASDIEQIEEVVCDSYTTFIKEKLNIALKTKKIKVSEGGSYRTQQFSIEFDEQFGKLQRGFNAKLKSEFPGKEKRVQMRSRIRKRMRRIFKSHFRR